MDTIPSTPDPTMIAIVYTVIRSILAILGAIGVTWGSSVSGAQWQIVAGAVAVLVSIGWSVWQKFQAATHTHNTALVSAKTGTAVQPK